MHGMAGMAGSPGLRGGRGQLAFVVLAATLAAAGTVPVERVALVHCIHWLISRAPTPTDRIGNGVATLVIAKWGARSTNAAAAGRRGQKQRTNVAGKRRCSDVCSWR